MKRSNKLTVQENERKIHLRHIVKVNEPVKPKEEHRKQLINLKTRLYYNIKSRQPKDMDSSSLYNTINVSKHPITVSKFLLDFKKIFNAKQNKANSKSSMREKKELQSMPNHSRVRSMNQQQFSNKCQDADYIFEDIYDLNKSLNTSSSQLETEQKN